MFQLPKLPYEYNALEPIIDEQTMLIHHSKHHQAYVDNLNKALEPAPELYQKSVEEILADLNKIPETVRQAVINNGGGHANHSFFWTIMSPSKTQKPDADLLNKINAQFESLENLKKQINQTGIARFGSGWAWLVAKNQELKIISTANQDSPLSAGFTPLIGIDIWEHAYYLKYQNRRADYLEAWWQVINWEEVNKRYVSIIKT